MRFGLVLRKTRDRVNVSGYAVAKHLGLTPAFIYDLETRGRLPLSPDSIERIAVFLGVDPTEMLLAAAQDRAGAVLPVEDSTPRDHLAVRLARAWGSLSEEQVQAIGAIVGRAA